MAISFDSALGIHEQALDVRSRRAEVLSNNLANVDTPNFKARDVDFKTMLNQQVNATGPLSSMQGASMQGVSMQPLKLAASHGGSQFDNANFSPVSETSDGDLLYRTPAQPSVDGNTVDENVEQAEFMKNALNWQASLQFLSARFKGLKDAIHGDA